MADDITYTSTSPAGPPNSTKQVTDEHATRGHMPVVKLGYSADGSATHAQVDADGVLVNLGAHNDVTVTGTVQTTGSFITISTDVTRPADTAVYAIDDAWSDSTSAPTSGGFTFTNAGRSSGGSGIITDAIFTTSPDPATRLQGELWIFNQAVTNINDNAAFAVSDSEIKTCVGKIPFTMEDAGNNGFYHAQNLAIGYTCSGSANLRFLVRVKNGYTPGSAEVLTCVIKCIRLD